jgi:hypothetical protein
MTHHQWTDKIPSSVVCNFFYVFFIIYSVLAGLSLLGGIVIFTTSKMSLGTLFANMFNTLLAFGISITMALFLYLICERALKPELQQDESQSQASLNYM